MSRGTIGGQRLPAPMELGRKRSNIIRTLPVKAGESVAAGDVVDVVSGAVTTGVAKLSTLAEGSIITLSEGGHSTEFYVAKHNYESGLNGTGRTLLIRNECYDNRQWHTAKVNAYAGSAVDSWLNGAYKNLFDADIRTAMGTTKFYYTPGDGNTTAATLQRSVFLLSVTELGRSGSATEGSALPIAGTLRIARLDGGASSQWTRSPYTPMSDAISDAWFLGSTGNAGNDYCTSNYGSRPVFTLPSSFSVRAISAVPSQAIALQSGSGGQSIDVIYDGVAELPGITAGTSIESPGVRGYAPVDGVLWARPEWDATRASGTYVGTGTSGKYNSNTLEFEFPPTIVVINGNGNTAIAIRGSSYMAVIMNGLVMGNEVTWGENGISWYNSSISGGIDYQLNKAGLQYSYVAL